MLNSKAFKSALLAGAALSAALWSVPQAQAQDPNEKVEKVTVTGTRIKSRDLSSNSPLQTIGGDALRQIGPSTIETYLNAVPQFSPTLTKVNNNPQGGGAANLDLRQLGSNRVLVLMDGRRIVPGASDGSVDVSVLPPSLIQRVEVITGGASAVYGSDAVSGVVNFILKDDFEGLEATAKYNITEYGDGEEVALSTVFGANTEDGRGNVTMSVGYNNRREIGAAARDISSAARFCDITGCFLNGSPTTPDGGILSLGAPFQPGVDALFATAPYGSHAPGTVAAAGPLFGAFPVLGFNTDGSLFATTSNGGAGNVLNYRGSRTSFDPTLYTYNFQPDNLLQLPFERYSAFARGKYDIIPGELKVWGEALFANYKAQTKLAPTPGSFTVDFDTLPLASIPADLQSIFTTSGFTYQPGTPAAATSFPSLILTRRFNELGPRNGQYNTTAYQASAGLNWDLEGIFENTEWSLEAFASHGEYFGDTYFKGYPSRSRTIAAVRGCPGGGLTPPGPGPCIQANVFGSGQLSAGTLKYIEEPYWDNSVFEQTNAQVNLTGDLLELWAGPLGFAIGAEYRDQSFSRKPSASLSSNDVLGANAAQPLTGGYDVYEAYGEVRLPLLSDITLFKYLGLEAGYRVSDYETGAYTETYKYGGEWSPWDWLKFRGMYQKAVRAPSLFELFLTQAEGFPGMTQRDPCSFNSAQRLGADGLVGGVGPNADGPNAAQVLALCQLQAPLTNFATYTFGPGGQYRSVGGGNPLLDPETAETTTWGFVFRPLERFSIAVDYFDIEISDVISSVGGNTSMSRCYNAAFNPAFSTANAFCQNIKRDPGLGGFASTTPFVPGVSGFISTTLQNLSTSVTKGMDVQFNYGFDFVDLDMPAWMGSLSGDFLMTYMEEQSLVPLPGDPTSEFTGLIGDGTPGDTARPKLKWNARAVWSTSDLSLTWRWVHIGHVFDGLATPANQNIPGIAEYDYHYLSGRYDLTDHLYVFGGVDNVFDKGPPIYTNAFQYNTDPSTYDTLGRSYYIGSTLRF